MLYRFGFVEDEVNTFWNENSEEVMKLKKKQKLRTSKKNKRDAPSKDAKTSVPKSLDNIINEKSTIGSIPLSTFTFLDEMRKIVPEVIKFQFFQKRDSDPHDCLLEICEKTLRDYRNQRIINLRNGDPFDKPGHVKEEEVITSNIF